MNILDFTTLWHDIIKYPVLGVMAVCALFIMIVVMSQSGNDSGISALNGQRQETYLGKNKGKTLEHKMKVLTVITSIIFAVLCIAFAVISKIFAE